MRPIISSVGAREVDRDLEKWYNGYERLAWFGAVGDAGSNPAFSAPFVVLVVRGRLMAAGEW